MFYDKQPIEKQKSYKRMLKIVGRLSRLFSTAEEPYLYYRAHENIFAKYFDVENNARSDDSADAYSKTGIGIGLKTWVGSDNQKVAEFGRLRPQYENLKGIDLVKKIAEYRNKRITTTMNAHGLNKMLYHIVKRVPNEMLIYEARFEMIDISNIKVDEKRGTENSIYFNDGKHTYKFSRSKNTLYMIFDDMELLDKFKVDIEADPYEFLEFMVAEKEDYLLISNTINKISKPQLCLRLYSVKKGEKYIPLHSGLNQWNGSRSQHDKKTGELKSTPRNRNELYIPYPKEDRNRGEFFPERNKSFSLLLPDGKWIKAKVCQDDGKAIMSNPNSELGKWLLRDVFELEEGTLVTYEMLKEFGIDSVIFTKLGECEYSIDFCSLGTYEKFYGLDDPDA